MTYVMILIGRVWRNRYANKTVFDEEQILGQLPTHMSSELVFLMYRVVIESTPFFNGLPKDVTVKLCLAMKPYP